MPGDETKLQGDEKTLEAEAQTPKQAETLTRQEADTQIAKAVQAVKTDVGRLTAELKRSQEIADAAIKRLNQAEEDEYRRREEAVKDDPSELSSIRKERQLARERAEVDADKVKVKTQLDNLMKVTAKALATQYYVSEEHLLKYAGDDAERMSELAISYGERKAPGEKTTRMKEAPDDGKTKGGSVGLTVEDVRKMSPEERNRRTSEIAKIPFPSS